MQKVVVVNVKTEPEYSEIFTELEFEKLNKYLEEGYNVVQFHSNTYAGVGFCTLIFILER